MTAHHLLDPTVADIDASAISAQREVNELLRQFPQPNVLATEGLRLLRSVTAPPQGIPQLTPRDITIAGVGGELRLHIFTPAEQPRAVIMRLHGGGWAAGAPEDDESINDQIARRCRVVVVSPDYRLVPEIFLADQIDDCLAAARWILQQAQARFGSTRVLLAGTSAGAHLAALTLIRLRDAADAGFASVVGAHLDCGGYDLSGTPSVRASTNETLVLSRGLIMGLVELGLPEMDLESRRDPALSPLYADLSDLPPALFTVGALDSLHDDSVFMALRWRLAGNHADLDVWPEGAHAFTNMGGPLAAVALERTVSWITALLDSLEHSS
jgi:acetyl esterase